MTCHYENSSTDDGLPSSAGTDVLTRLLVLAYTEAYCRSQAKKCCVARQDYWAMAWCDLADAAHAEMLALLS